ncbi:MAG: rhomboid family intramembrane serine protease [Thermoclostridium sp.]|nr:rhomboid family intramembrane serine protease [Thermoclostridium sp.]
MKFLDKLDRKYGKFAIRNLAIYIAAGNLAVFLFSFVMPSIPGYLTLVPSLVMQGQVWRLITYIFIPPTFSILFILLTVYFYYMIGSTLEREWGSFHLNVYYFIGMLATTIAAFITGGTNNIHLNLSLFLAFAYLYPNHEILLFFFLPVKMKYLAWFNLALIGITILFGTWQDKIAAIVSLANYLLFFGDDMFKRMKTRRSSYYNRKNYFKQIEEGRKANERNLHK